MRSRTADPSRLCQSFKLAGRRNSLVSASLIKPVMNRTGPVINSLRPVSELITQVKGRVGDPKRQAVDS